MNALNINGRKRPTLSEQIERLDGILDGLADNLNQAVADAVKEAIKSVLKEVLSNPDVLGKLQAVVSSPAPVAESSKPVVRDTVSRAWQWFGTTLKTSCQKCISALGRLWQGCNVYSRQVVQQVCTLSGHLGVIRRFWRPLLLASAIGGVVAIAAFWAGPSLATVASGVGGFGSALGVQIGLWVRRVLATGASGTA